VARANFVLGVIGLLLFLSTAPARAGILLTGATGETVYGASAFCCVDNAGAIYLLNNITGASDILASPGNGFQTANPVFGNNVAQSGLFAAPYFFSFTGGSSPDGAFGAGVTSNGGQTIGFGLNDADAGCCTASYTITSVFDNYIVSGSSFTGNLGAYLSIAGVNLTGADSSIASLVVEYQINNGSVISLPQMVLAAIGDCSTSVAIGGSGAALLNDACSSGGNGGAYSGLAIDNFSVVDLPVGTTIQVTATLTAYSDPSSVGSYNPDATLISDTGATLPDFALVDTGTEDPVPEPGTLALVGLGLLAMGGVIRRRGRRTRR